MHCDARVQTVCADVMSLPKDQIRALSPKVLSKIEFHVCSLQF